MEEEEEAAMLAPSRLRNSSNPGTQLSIAQGARLGMAPTSKEGKWRFRDVAVMQYHNP